MLSDMVTYCVKLSDMVTYCVKLSDMVTCCEGQIEGVAQLKDVMVTTILIEEGIPGQ
jgi:hypothetical protein